MKSKLYFAALLLVPSVANAQLTTASGTGTTTVKTTVAAPTILTSEQRRAFEASLAGADQVADMANTEPLVVLTWTALPGMTYKVLRYSMLSSPPALLTPPETGPRYVASVLPGKDFYFRVVAYGSGGSPVDTTASYHTTVPGLAHTGGGYADRNAMGSISLTCSVTASNLSMSWTKQPNIDDFSVVVRPGPGISGSPAVNTTVSAGAFTQNGLPAGTWEVDVTGNYVMTDYPVPGQTTRVPAQEGKRIAVIPSATQTPCPTR